MKQVFINLLGELEALMHMKGQPFRGRAYHKAAESLMNYQKKITKSEELKELPNIGPSILKKFKEYEETGKLRILEEAKKNPIYMFTTIFGIGPKKAKKLVETEKITTIEQLRERQEDVLNNVQKKGLKYFEDVQLRIPRNEINKFKIRLEEIFNNLKNIDGSSFEIVGSYRRGNTESGDIDIIITNNKNNKKVFAEFLTNLVKAGLLVDIFSKGKTKSLAIGKIENCPCRRLDFLYTPPKEYPFAILYFTGSKAFNVVMRAHSLKLGYSMNEHGFHIMNDKKKGKRLDKFFTTEKSIFEFLKIVYKKPHERIDGRALVSLQ
jgi:DNA polymerase/3'-5' exonuclease PolX